MPSLTSVVKQLPQTHCAGMAISSLDSGKGSGWLAIQRLTLEALAVAEWLWVNSQSKCTTLGGRKDFMWYLEVEALPRSMIQFFDDLCKRFIRYVGEVGAFREVLSQPPAAKGSSLAIKHPA